MLGRMHSSEPHATALALLVIGALLTVSVLASRIAGRLSVPVALLYLGVGMLAGSEGIGGIAFESYGAAFRIGTVALVLILFDGGLNTSVAAVRKTIGPAAVLASLGVIATAVLTAFGAHLLGLDWRTSALIGAVVSSTDAATVFSVLRGSRVELTRRVATTLELESGLNDPMAVMLTVALTKAMVSPRALGWRLGLEIVVQMLIGAIGGWLIGRGGRWLLSRQRLTVHGLLPVLTVALAFVAFGAPTVFYGSGFLAVYVAAIILGDGELPYRAGLLRVHDALAWFSQVAMFVLLGLLCFPSRLLEVGWVGLGVGLILAFVARPLAVLLCLLPFGYRAREIAYVGWVGLRGAVPIILATFPVLAGVPGGHRIFDIVFFVVVVNAIVPGSTVRWVTKLLGVEIHGPPPPRALLEITTTQKLAGDLLHFYISPASTVAGAKISELPFPSGASLVVIVRGDELVAPRGDSVMTPGDHVYVLCRREDRPLVHLMFGRPEEE
jgi:potassium/hydrogen antiporter